MGSLAQFVLKGRKQAILAVIILGAIPLVYLLNPVVVGLIMLRKGVSEAAVILCWALLPMVTWAYVFGDMIPLIMLFGLTGLAWLLRETQSWQFTMLGAIAIGVVVEIYLHLQPAIMDNFFIQLEIILAQNEVESLQGSFSLEELREVLISMIGSGYMFVSIMLLMLCRWMQANLFNPGGFQTEIHLLRIDRKIAFVLVVLVVLSLFGIVVPQAWLFYLLIPLVIAGMALVHYTVAQRKLSSLYLVAMYALIVIKPQTVLQVIVLLALVDSQLDLRKKINKSGST
ncbi:MAG: hypothetical protein COC19_02880 [SAR86 cluster bacterium]|uniref:DUF2232 domain-containing protein n=1 Tax=SAR86 cluster bacterium TaxID=2030880 RepID=A0A2A4MS63_9GAMM|nr:MAG: hypothetical protein COC19_02880 [SAR86 cluster bacterium]